MRSRSLALLLTPTLLLACQPGDPAPPAGAILGESGLGARVFVVERDSGSLAVYDFQRRQLLPHRIEGLGDLRHATMTFSPDLRWAYLATRSGLLTRIDLTTLERAGDAQVSNSSIDIAITQDGRFIATAEYSPGGVTILDSQSLKVVKRIEATFVRDDEILPSRVTGIVDAPGNKLICVLMEGAEIWVIDAASPDFPVIARVPTREDQPYDAMITPDGRSYLVGHISSGEVSLLDVAHPKNALLEVSLRDPEKSFDKSTPVKLPHLASWAVAGRRAFVPLVGERRLAVLDTATWRLEGSVEVLGNPVYAVASPSQNEIWVSFSGEGDDKFLQVIDARTLEPKKTIEVGRRIYHFDFTPRGAYVLVSANADNLLALVNASSYAVEDRQSLRSPSGIFGVWRAYRIGL